MQLVFFRLHLMLYARTANIRYDGYCSTFWDFGLELNVGFALSSPPRAGGGALTFALRFEY